MGPETARHAFRTAFTFAATVGTFLSPYAANAQDNREPSYSSPVGGNIAEGLFGLVQMPEEVVNGIPTSISGESARTIDGWTDVSAPKKQFAKDFLLAIDQATAKKGGDLGVNPSVVFAQAIRESGWGQSALAINARNFFGIKAGSSWTGPTITMQTTEYVNGQPVQKDDVFRSYGTAEESLEDYINFITSRPQYSDAVACRGNNEAYLKGLVNDLGGDCKTIEKAQGTSGVLSYATDPNYVGATLAVITLRDADQLIKNEAAMMKLALQASPTPTSPATASPTATATNTSLVPISGETAKPNTSTDSLTAVDGDTSGITNFDEIALLIGTDASSTSSLQKQIVPNPSEILQGNTTPKNIQLPAFDPTKASSPATSQPIPSSTATPTASATSSQNPNIAVVPTVNSTAKVPGSSSTAESRPSTTSSGVAELTPTAASSDIYVPTDGDATFQATPNVQPTSQASSSQPSATASASKTTASEAQPTQAPTSATPTPSAVAAAPPTTVAAAEKTKSQEEYENQKRAEIVDVLKSQLGVKEAPYRCDKGNPSTKGDCGRVSVYTQGLLEYWCADFATWAQNEAGLPVTGNSAAWRIAGVSTVGKAGQARGLYYDNAGYTPKPADMILFKNSDGSTHIATVISVNGNKVTYIGGNQAPGSGQNGSAVTEETTTLSSGRITGYVQPNFTGKR